MNCPRCGSTRLRWWHYYDKFGGSGAYHCLNCGAMFKAVTDRRTLRHKVGKFLKYS